MAANAGADASVGGPTCAVRSAQSPLVAPSVRLPSCFSAPRVLRNLMAASSTSPPRLQLRWLRPAATGPALPKPIGRARTGITAPYVAANTRHPTRTDPLTPTVKCYGGSRKTTKERQVAATSADVSAIVRSQSRNKCSTAPLKPSPRKQLDRDAGSALMVGLLKCRSIRCADRW